MCELALLIVPCLQVIAAPHVLRTTSRNRSDLLLHRRRLASRDVARLRRAAAAHLGEHPAEAAKAALREAGAALANATGNEVPRFGDAARNAEVRASGGSP